MPPAWWMLLITLLVAACGHQNATGSTSRSTTPGPSPSTCWIYDEMFPATKAAFDAQHVTPAGRREIELFASPSTPARLRLAKTYSPFASLPTAAQVPDVRWMRADMSRRLMIFTIDNKDGPWGGLNGNFMVDTEDCIIVATPA